MSVEHTMCEYCGSVNGGHTMACQSIHETGPKPRQVPIPESSPWLQRRRTEEAALSAQGEPK